MIFEDIRSLLITEVQKEFTRSYPFLKIEFGRGGAPVHMPLSLDSNRYESSPDAISKQAGGVLHNTIGISDSMKVGELEKKLQEQFGGMVQLFRKSGNLWMETRMTQNWTLGEQNDHGEDITIGFP